MPKLSINRMRAREPVPGWNHVARTMVPMQVEAKERNPVVAQFVRHRLGDIDLIWVRSGLAQFSNAPDGHVRGRFNLLVQSEGRSINHVGGRTIILEQGDLILYDPGQPHWAGFDTNHEAIIVQIPAIKALSRVPHLGHMVGARIDGKTGHGALFSSFLQTVWRQMKFNHCDWNETLPDLVWQFIASTYAAPRVALNVPSRRDDYRRKLLAAVERSLSTPNFGAREIARDLRVSARYVQMLFADMGTTPGSYIQNCRLELAAARLEDSTRHLAITQVAYDIGFNDLSGFCRAFRKKFGVSPRQYRAGLRGASTDSVGRSAEGICCDNFRN